MAKDVINVGGEETVVREDTAKAYRGTIWILSVVGMVLVGAAILFLLLYLVPQVLSLVKTMGVTLPLPTLILL